MPSLAQGIYFENYRTRLRWGANLEHLCEIGRPTVVRELGGRLLQWESAVILKGLKTAPFTPVAGPDSPADCELPQGMSWMQFWPAPNSFNDGRAAFDGWSKHLLRLFGPPKQKRHSPKYGPEYPWWTWRVDRCTLHLAMAERFVDYTWLLVKGPASHRRGKQGR